MGHGQSDMITRFIIVTVCVLVGLFIACDQGTSPPTVEEAFFFRVVVKDPAGNPVPGVRVSVYPPYDVGWLPKSSIIPSPLGVNASSTLNFALAATARVSLILYDLDGATIQQLIGNQLLNPGVYAYTIALQRREGARVMRCRLVARDTATGNVAFRDSIYVTLWQPDAQVAVLGYTSGSGTVESRDTLAFPYILSLPPIVVTRFDPTPVGTFFFPDSCVITLTDTATAAQVTLGRRLVRGPNEIPVTWHPVGSPAPLRQGGKSPFPQPSALRSVLGNTFEWRLYQNYPNPFN